jgi:glucokinase
MSARGDASGRFTLGVDIGGSKLLAVLADGEGERVGASISPTPQSADPVGFWQAIRATCQGALDSGGVVPEQVVGVGMALAGVVDSRSHRTRHSPYTPAVEALDLEAEVGRWLGVVPVMDNDANMAALGEHWLGAARGASDFVYVTLSTGFGAGIVAGGRLVRGAHGFAGEPGSLCPAAFGAGGAPSEQRWKPTCTGSAIAELMAAQEAQLVAPEGMSMATAAGAITAEAVFARHAAGEAGASLIVENAVEQLGVSLTRIVDLLDPQVIVVGGGLANRWDDYVAPAVGFMRREAFAAPLREVAVVPAALGNESGCWGAIGCAQGVLGSDG